MMAIFIGVSNKSQKLLLDFTIVTDMGKKKIQITKTDFSSEMR